MSWSSVQLVLSMYNLLLLELKQIDFIQDLPKGDCRKETQLASHNFLQGKNFKIVFMTKYYNQTLYIGDIMGK